MSALDCLAAFKSIHDVMKAEEILLEHGARYDLVPMPRSLDASCGMAVLFPCGEASELTALLRARGAVPSRLHRRSGDSWEPLENG